MRRKLVSIIDFVYGIWVYEITNIWRVEFLQAIAYLLFGRKFHEILETVPLFIALLDPFIRKLATFALFRAGIALPQLLCEIAFLVVFAAHGVRIDSRVQTVNLRVVVVFESSHFT